jgi:hypothetical protein
MHTCTCTHTCTFVHTSFQTNTRRHEHADIRSRALSVCLCTLIGNARTFQRETRPSDPPAASVNGDTATKALTASVWATSSPTQTGRIVRRPLGAVTAVPVAAAAAGSAPPLPLPLPPPAQADQVLIHTPK